MASVRTLIVMMAMIFTAIALGRGFVNRSNDRLVGRAVRPNSDLARVAPSSWLEAARMGAPVYRLAGGLSLLPPLPEGKVIVLTGNGYAFATDDVAEVKRWYAVLSAPTLDLSRFPSVRYIYEVEAAELVTEPDGRQVLALTIHESRTGCERPSCDPVTELPNYDRRYVLKPSNAIVKVSGGSHA